MSWIQPSLFPLTMPQLVLMLEKKTTQVLNLVQILEASLLYNRSKQPIIEQERKSTCFGSHNSLSCSCSYLSWFLFCKSFSQFSMSEVHWKKTNMVNFNL
ncbi:uncharacterized protein DS421_1g04490 [Arachis hypogaea]|nr:uncharacterized protein DS421_1g04490 [Arachis hypogaea]